MCDEAHTNTYSSWTSISFIMLWSGKSYRWQRNLRLYFVCTCFKYHHRDLVHHSTPTNFSPCFPFTLLSLSHIAFATLASHPGPAQYRYFLDPSLASQDQLQVTHCTLLSLLSLTTMAYRYALPALSLLSFFSSTVTASLPVISTVGNKFFDASGNQFFIKGVAYQLLPTDPLVDTTQCQQDATLMQSLGTNAIRV
jgi:hypothetical protein